MDPLTIAGLSGAGYLLLKSSQSDTQIDESHPPNGLALHDALAHNIKLETLNFADGRLSLGGKAPIEIPPQPINVSQILGPAMGLVGTGLAVLAAVGGGSVAAGASAVAGGVAVGALWAVAVVAIVGYVILNIFAIFDEVEAKSKGRKYYMANMYQMAYTLETAILPIIKGCGPEDTGKIARCFTYVVCRGFNRSQIAFILQNYHSPYNPVDNDIHLNYWADRARCVPEIGYIHHDERGVGPNRFLSDEFWHTVVGDSVEAHIFGDNSSYVTETQALTAKGLWSDADAAGSEESCADFIGRALGAMYLASHNYTGGDGTGLSLNMQLNTSPETNAQAFTSMGIIGTQCGFPGEYAPGIRGEPDANRIKRMIEIPILLNQTDGTISDFEGKSGLKWFYRESAATGKTVIR